MDFEPHKKGSHQRYYEIEKVDMNEIKDRNVNYEIHSETAVFRALT